MSRGMDKKSSANDSTESISPGRWQSRQRVRHEKDDTIKAFGEIHPSPESFRQQMVEIANHKSRRNGARDWISNMRFLVIDHPEQSILHPETVEAAPSSRQWPSLFDLVNESEDHVMQLRLKKRQEMSDPNAYVAVSYTWNRENSEWLDDLHLPQVQVLVDENPPRGTTIPSDVLYRSIVYAMHRGISAIWIDQECINQDDARDKEDGIQAMDIVYEEACESIVTLECYMDRQEHIDLLEAAVQGEEFQPDLIEALVELLEALLIDAWFTRAWTLQESMSAGVSMTLLIPCDPALRKPKELGPNPGEIELSIFNFQNAMVHIRCLIEEGLAAAAWEDEGNAIYASNCADNLWNFVPTRTLDSLDSSSSRRGSCYASEAMTFLEARQNSHFPDRLAILANLCNFETRIDTDILASSDYSFSTCALTLAILNGDMSVLGGYGARGEEIWDLQGHIAGVIDLARDGRSLGIVFRNDDMDSPSRSYGFSWGPPPYGRLSDIAYEEDTYAPKFLLRPSTLSDDGLRVHGMLWEVNHVVRVPLTQSSFLARWEEELEMQSGVSTYSREADLRGQPLSQDFIWALLHELFNAGYDDLVKTLWNFFQPRNSDERSSHPLAMSYPYPFPMIFSHAKNSSDGAHSLPYDPKDVMKRMWIQTLIVDVERSPFEGPTMVRNLLEQVCRHGKLLCGNAFHGPDRSIRVIFEACTEGDLVFTPSTTLGDRVADLPYRSQAMSWRVTRSGNSADGCEVLNCLGRRRGIWRMDDLDAVDYILD